VSSTSDRTRQFEVIQVTGKNVSAKFGRITGDLINQITSG